MNNSETVWFGKIAASHSVPENKTGAFPIVFIHGSWGGKYQFENWMRYCAERGWESYALDLRGHYESTAEDLGKISMDEYAQDVEAALERIGPCYLVGHSMGGLISQLVASRSKNVQKLVLVCSTPPAGIPYIGPFPLTVFFKGFVRMLRSQPISISRSDAEKFFGISGLGQGAFEMLVPDSGRAFADISFLRVKVGKLLCPSLVIASAGDKTIPYGVGKALAKKYGSTYKEIEGMGHMVMLEKDSERPIETILTWLKG